VSDIERFHPLGARIFLRPDAPADHVGRIIIPDNAKKPTGTGTVMAFGPGMLCKDGSRWPMPDIKRGDRVWYDARNPFMTVKIDGLELISLRDDDVLAVIEE
jgi:co-chaperonin GroES (HSP10)